MKNSILDTRSLLEHNHIFDTVDFTELRHQKLALLVVIDSLDPDSDLEKGLSGILHFLDGFQNEAVKEHGKDEAVVFGTDPIPMKKRILIERFYPNYDNCDTILEEELYSKFLNDEEMSATDVKWILEYNRYSLGRVRQTHNDLLNGIWEKTFQVISSIDCPTFGDNSLDDDLTTAYNEDWKGETAQESFDIALKNILTLVIREQEKEIM
tara:strand:+ start:56 stop:685 length:630 start_codon:yes stop_codon:yes gene_type:complete